MGLFITVFIFIAFFGLFEIYNKKIQFVTIRRMKKIDYSDFYLSATFFILFIICAFRDPTVGTDTLTYVRSFLSPSFLDLTIDGGEKFEFGYKLLVHIIRRFSMNEQVFIIVSTTIMFYGMYIFIRDNCKGYYSVAMLVFTSFLYYTYFSAMRQCIAISISVNCIKYLKKRKWLNAALIIIAGGLFHTTAFILLIFIPLAFTSWTRKKVIISIISSFVGITLFERIINLVIQFIPIYGRYLRNGIMDSSGRSVGLFAILVGSLCVVSSYIIYTEWNSFKNEDTRNEFILSLIGSIFTLFINLLGRQYGIFSRITRYFIPFTIILVVCLFKNNIRNKKIVYIGLAGLMCLYFYIIMNANIYKIIPYKMFY